jgi:uncharacterized protein (DUF1501 family)
MVTRRDFLARSSLVALSPLVPAFLARTASAAGVEKDRRVLVVVQLDGGNDGINTVVPHKDEGYAEHRRSLRLTSQQLIKVTDEVGLHQAMRPVADILEKGRLAIVQGVGYPNPSRSHFESMAVWQSARRDPRDHNQYGWLGRAFDAVEQPQGAAFVYAGAGELPVALRGRRAVASALTRPEDFLLDPLVKGTEVKERPGEDLTAFVQRYAVDARSSAERMAEVFRSSQGGPSYPSSALAKHMQMIARLIKGGAGARVYYARQGGYDTHSAQVGTHFQLLRDLSEAIAAFIKDMDDAKLLERVVLLSFSEFGRTVKENGSSGTDHGTAGPVLLAGPVAKSGLIGDTPSLTDLDPKHGDLKVQYDFRQVYASVLEDWLGISSKSALGEEYSKVSLFA